MKEHSVRNSVLGGLLWKFGERVLSQGITFVVSLILARLLSPVLDVEPAVIERKASDTSKGGVTLKEYILQKAFAGTSGLKKFILRNGAYQTGCLVSHAVTPKTVCHGAENALPVTDGDQKVLVDLSSPGVGIFCNLYFQKTAPPFTWFIIP